MSNEFSQAFVTANYFIMETYVEAYKEKDCRDFVISLRDKACGAFEMFRLLYPNEYEENELNSFWEYYDRLFNTLIYTKDLKEK